MMSLFHWRCEVSLTRAVLFWRVQRAQNRAAQTCFLFAFSKGMKTLSHVEYIVMKIIAYLPCKNSEFDS